MENMKTPQRGDRVLVRDSVSRPWVERIFVSYIQGARYPYVCVLPEHEADFINGVPFLFNTYGYMKRINKVVTEAEVAKAFGVDSFDELHIIK